MQQIGIAQELHDDHSSVCWPELEHLLLSMLNPYLLSAEDPILSSYLARQLSVSKGQWQAYTREMADPDTFNFKESSLARR